MSLHPWLKKLDNPPPSVEDASIDREEPEAAVQDIQTTEASTSSLVEDTTSLIPDSSNQTRAVISTADIWNAETVFLFILVWQVQMVTLSGGTDRVFCYYCSVADKRGLKTWKDETFSKTEFCNWKKALNKFDKHEQTMSHRVAIGVVVTIPSTTNNVGEMLSSSLADQRSRNKNIPLVIPSNIQFLARQGLALRGQ